MDEASLVRFLNSVYAHLGLVESCSRKAIESLSKYQNPAQAILDIQEGQKDLFLVYELMKEVQENYVWKIKKE